jgi:hypothetical protein
VAYVTTMDLAASGLPDLTKQPFALELYLRRSQDGSALAVMPTLLAYHQALQDGDTGSKARDLYVTLTFATPGSDKSSTASLSLGSRRPSGDVVSFEAVSAPARSGGAYATGEAATVWIANPFAGPPAPPPKADAAKPADAAAAAAAAKAKPKGAKPTSTEMDGTPRLIRIADPQPGGGFGKNVAPPANPATPATVAADAPGGPSLDVAPISVTITVRETRPGSPIAAILAVALKGSKPALVAAVDPTSIAAAQAAKATANQVATTAYVNALGDYYTKRSAYCATPMDAPAGVDVMKAQMNLVFAAKPLAATVPFTGQIVPQSGDKSICP